MWEAGGGESDGDEEGGGVVMGWLEWEDGVVCFVVLSDCRDRYCIDLDV